MEITREGFCARPIQLCLELFKVMQMCRQYRHPEPESLLFHRASSSLGLEIDVVSFCEFLFRFIVGISYNFNACFPYSS